MEKLPLAKWKAEPGSVSATTNSRYECAGEITMTIPLEYAAVFLGMMGPLPGEKSLNDGSKLTMSRLYDALSVTLESYGFTLSDPRRVYGRDVIRRPEDRPSYMDTPS